PTQDRQHVRRAAHLPAELPRPRVRARDVVRGVALGRGQGGPRGDLEAQLALRPLTRRRLRGERLEPPRRVLGRLAVGVLAQGVVARLPAIPRRALEVPAALEVDGARGGALARSLALAAPAAVRR